MGVFTSADGLGSRRPLKIPVARLPGRSSVAPDRRGRCPVRCFPSRRYLKARKVVVRASGYRVARTLGSPVHPHERKLCRVRVPSLVATSYDVR